jgi:phosphinothricin acetyltransferase
MTSKAAVPPIAVRDCAEADLVAVQAIYAHHVLHGLASFEIEPPSQEEIARRWRAVRDGGFPYLVAERGREIVGYAYAGPYRTRPGYRYTAENSVYVRADCAGQGIGGLLLAELIVRCEAAGLRQLIAVIGDSANAASIQLHRRAGFETVGTFGSVGYKFDRWVDTVLMQRSLGRGDAAPP